MAWLTTAAWGQHAQHFPFIDSFTRYYARRAPLVGLVAGVLWAPLFCVASESAGRAGGRGGAEGAGAEPEGAEEEIARSRPWLYAGLQGLALGPLVSATATVALLFVWPSDLQNDRFEAVKWSLRFWRLSWWLLVPLGALSGLLSIAVARYARPKLKPGAHSET